MTSISNNVMIVESMTSKFAKVEKPSINVPEGMMLVEGVLGVANIKNRNNRYYTVEEYRRHVDSFKKRIVAENGVFGEMEHPKSMTINLHNVSHKVMAVDVNENGVVQGTLLLLDTPSGKIAQSIVRSGSALPVSSRALGSVNEKTGETTLDFLSTWDLVGTAGFKEAGVKQLVQESSEADGMIVESCVLAVDNNGQIIEESASAVHSSDLKQIVETYLAENMSEIKVNDNNVDDELAKEMSGNFDIDTVMQHVDERFKTVYASAIETWVLEDYSRKIADSIQKWVVEEFSPTVQSWLTEEYTPVIAENIESWVKNEYTPVIAESIQSWVTKEFAPELGSIVESWLSEKDLTNIAAEIEKSAADEPETSVENADKTIAQEIKQTVETPVQESAAQQFKSAILRSINEHVAVADAATTEVAEPARIDEAEFKAGPVWLQLIPQEFKQSWQALNESQRDMVYRKASLRTLRSKTDIDIFWKGLNFNAIVEAHMPSQVNRQIVESMQPQTANPRQSIFALAKRLNG